MNNTLNAILGVVEIVVSPFVMGGFMRIFYERVSTEH